MKNENEITEEQEVFYGNYGLREICDCCGNDARIHNYGNEYEHPVILLQNTQFLCEICRK